MRKEPEPQAGSRILSLAACLGVLPSSSLPTVCLDDVVHDVGGRVIDAAGLPDFGLFLDLGAVAFGQADDFAEELLVDLAEDVGREDGEVVGLIRGSRGRLMMSRRSLSSMSRARVSSSGASWRPFSGLKWNRPEL